MARKLTRRALLGVIPIGWVAQTGNRTATPAPKKAKPLPSVGEFTRITDGVTENLVVRLTSPAFTSHLTGLGNQFVSVRERLLLFCTNRTGRMAPFQVDLRNGALRQIAEPEKLDYRSLCLDKSQKAAYFLDGDRIHQAGLGKGGLQTLAQGVSWFRLGANGELFAIQGGRLVLREGSAWRTLAEEAVACWPQPNGAGCLFARKLDEPERQFWYVASNGANKPVLLASGRIRDPYWDTDGVSILFLRDVINATGVTLAEIHSKGLNGEAEAFVAPTSQFAAFAPNGDASVFVGASRSRAQPTIVLQLRTPSREMTLCEHASRHPEDVRPSFSPDSRRVYFESEHEGNPAIYSVSVEYLVEPLATGS